MPLLSGLRVVRSSIDGYGVVATRPFVAGDLLAEVDGVAWRDGDAVDDRYSLWIDDGLYFDMVDQTRWINHSCEPNGEVEADLDVDSRLCAARIVAIRPIATGDEITYDYGFTADVAEPCACGSRACRGFIVDEEELPRLLVRSAG
jgi:uncharacterized protein